MNAGKSATPLKHEDGRQEQIAAAIDAQRARIEQAERSEESFAAKLEGMLDYLESEDFNADITEGIEAAQADIAAEQSAVDKAADERFAAAVFGQNAPGLNSPQIAAGLSPVNRDTNAFRPVPVQYAEDPLTLPERTRVRMQKELDLCVAAKAAFEKQLGEAKRDLAEAVASLERDYEIERRKIAAQLEGLTITKEALDLAVARLNKSAG